MCLRFVLLCLCFAKHKQSNAIQNDTKAFEALLVDRKAMAYNAYWFQNKIYSCKIRDLLINRSHKTKGFVTEARETTLLFHRDRASLRTSQNTTVFAFEGGSRNKVDKPLKGIWHQGTGQQPCSCTTLLCTSKAKIKFQIVSNSTIVTFLCLLYISCVTVILVKERHVEFVNLL